MVLKINFKSFLEVTLAQDHNQHGFKERRNYLSKELGHHDNMLYGLEEGANMVKRYIKLALWIYDWVSGRKALILANGLSWQNHVCRVVSHREQSLDLPYFSGCLMT